MKIAWFGNRSRLRWSLQLSGPTPTFTKIRRCSHLQALTAVRYASNSRRKPEQGQNVVPITPAQGQDSMPSDRQRQIRLAKEAFLALKRKQAVRQKSAIRNSKSQDTSKKMESCRQGRKPRDAEAGKKEPNYFRMDSEDFAHRRFIMNERCKIFKPAIWTFFAMLGTYGTFAYLDATWETDLVAESSWNHTRQQLPQSWILTPTVIIEGIKAGWRDLDKLTIGFVLVTVLVQYTQRSRIPFWELLLHITGEKRYTAFTYSFAHTDWQHLGQNLFVAIWFLPSVVRLFDGDLYHTAAFCMTMPLVTSFVDHFAFRWTRIRGIPVSIGASGMLAAVFGAFCMAYPNEKIWIPVFFFLRLDAVYWAGLFAFQQISTIYPSRNTINRPAVWAHFLSAVLGAVYIYFDGKNLIWNPLVEFFKKPLHGDKPNHEGKSY